MRAVDGVSFAVAEGASLGIVGESGCGKSVTALSLMRLVPSPPGRISGGQILWQGRDLLTLSYSEMATIRGREMAMIFQDPMTSLNPVYNIERQVGEVVQRRFRTTRAETRKRVIAALDSVGIPAPEERLRAYPHELSGGMKQRVLIAMALLCEPRILIADEPTTALDVTIQKQVLHLIKDLQRRTGMALVMITHSLGVIAETCDEVLVMYAGRVAERATAMDLFDRPRHPYSRGLLDSIVRPGQLKDTPLPTIEGTVPSPLNLPPGCRFGDRCPRVQDRCRAEDPQLREEAAGGAVACHFPLEESR